MLLKANLTIIKQSVCEREYHQSGWAADGTICAGADGRAVCFGDNGGPAVAYDAQAGRWQLIGITSRVVCQPAKLSHPSVFTRVSRFLPWIKEVMAKN